MNDYGQFRVERKDGQHMTGKQELDLIYESIAGATMTRANGSEPFPEIRTKIGGSKTNEIPNHKAKRQMKELDEDCHRLALKWQTRSDRIFDPRRGCVQCGIWYVPIQGDNHICPFCEYGL